MPRSISKHARPLPLGVDLVEIPRARRFYRTHLDSLGSFFTPVEMDFIRSGRMLSGPEERLGLLLAAKEAVFKAVSPRPTGFLAFRGIEILARGSGKLTYNWRNARALKKAAPGPLELKWFRTKKYIVVECFHALGSHKRVRVS